LSNADTNPNSVFTREFIVRMKQPGVRIEDIVREVQDAVEQLAKSVKHEQRPALYNESRGNFYFYGAKASQQNAVATQLAPQPPMPAPPPAPINPDQREDDYWSDAKKAGNKEAFEAYINAYPKGRYANLAKANISQLKTNTAPPPKKNDDSDLGLKIFKSFLDEMIKNKD